MSGYSLWSKPWIPVQPLEGLATKVSLHQALTQAHTFRGVLDPSPLITVALHRLLLALIYRTHPLRRFSDWQAVWEAGVLDTTAITSYGEQMAHRFDLLHPTHPFYQVGFMEEARVHPMAALVETSKDNSPALFDHGRVEGSFELDLDRAACYLLAHQLFAVPGGRSKPFYRSDAPLTAGMVVEVVGGTLFETLMLNAMTVDQWGDLVPTDGTDRPSWEEECSPEPVKEGTPPLGILDYLTWQSRRIHLVVDEQRRVVTGCQIAQRYCLPKDGSRYDPGKAYYLSKGKGFKPRRLQRDRAAWRLTHVLLQTSEHKQSQPQVVAWLAALRRRERRFDKPTLPKSVSLTVSGLTTDPTKAAKIELWRREEIGLPLALLENKQLIDHVSRFMKTAGLVEHHLRRTGEALIWAMTQRAHQAEAIQYIWTGKTGSSKMPPTVGSVARSLGITLAYWAAMEAPFRRMLWRLPEEDPAAVTASWHEALQDNAKAAVTAALTRLKVGGSPWEPLSLVEDAFGRRLTRVLEKGREEAGNDDSDED